MANISLPPPFEKFAHGLKLKSIIIIYVNIMGRFILFYSITRSASSNQKLIAIVVWKNLHAYPNYGKQRLGGGPATFNRFVIVNYVK